MAEPFDETSPPEKTPTLARDGSPIDPETASTFVKEQIWGIWDRLRDVVIGDVHGSVGKADRAAREEAVSDGFNDLIEEVIADPGDWLVSPAKFDQARFVGEWSARSRRHFNGWERSFHRDLAAGLETERLGVLGEAGPAEAEAKVHPALDWATASGIDLHEVRRRFPLLLEQESYVPALTLLMWCTGRELDDIASELRQLSGDQAIHASDVLVRLVRMYRREPNGWISVASYCTAVTSPQISVAGSRREDDLVTVQSRDGWRDPFASVRHPKSVALLIQWMERTGKLADVPKRPTYEWSPEEKRTLVARRVATGFAQHIRSYDRARRQILNSDDRHEGKEPGAASLSPRQSVGSS